MAIFFGGLILAIGLAAAGDFIGRGLSVIGNAINHVADEMRAARRDVGKQREAARRRGVEHDA